MKDIIYAIGWLLIYKPYFNAVIAKHQPRPTQSQLWGLAAGGNLTKLNGNNFDYLHNGKSAGINRHTLQSWWDVKNPQDLASTLDWLENEGQRASFEVLYRRLSEPNLQIPNRPDYQFILENRQLFKNGTLLAWDLGRLINVVRYGYTAKYLDEATAWQKIMSAAWRLQQEYSSWGELGANYMLGWKIWTMQSNPQQASFESVHRDTLKWLNTNPNSPWQKLPWNLPLA